MMAQTNQISLRSAALTAGIALLIAAISAPFAEMYVFPKLIVSYKPMETAANVLANEPLYIAGIYGYLVCFICDLVITWALYILLKPVNEHLSMLTALFRLVYTVIALVTLMNLVTAFRLLTTPEYLTIFEKDQLYAQAMIYLRAFKNQWYFGIIFFAIHLLMLGYMVLKSTFIPKIMGILLLISGSGYLLNTLRPYLFPSVNVDFAMYTFFGELVFMLWLLIKGPKIQLPGIQNEGSNQ